jgi:hypothetical protein
MVLGKFCALRLEKIKLLLYNECNVTVIGK